MLKPSQIRKNDFSKSTMGGYKTAEVDDFLNEVYASYEQMYRENKDLLKKLRILVENIEEYRKKEQKLEMAESILSEAESKAKRVVDAAQKNAEKIIAQARAVSDLALAENSAPSPALAEAEEKALKIAREKSKEFKNSLISMYNDQIQMLKSILGDDEESAVKGEPGKQLKPSFERKISFDTVTADTKFVYNDVDEFIEAELAKDGRIKEAFGGFKFEMGISDDSPSITPTPKEGHVLIPDAPFEKTEAEVQDKENPQKSEDNTASAESAAESNAASDNNETTIEAESEVKAKPAFKISFFDENGESNVDKENLDELFQGFFNDKEKKNGKK